MPVQQTKTKKKITILSLDGGGIRGIITCVILRYIEEQLREQHHSEAKLGDYFDLIAGSSTGGLIASILLYPDENKKAKYSIEKAFELYAQKGENIFNVSSWEKIINPLGLFDEKISAKNLESLLNGFFGDLELKDLTKPSLITAYDIYNRKAKLFNTIDGIQPIRNFYVRDICRATSAAPTYFEPARIRSLYGKDFDLIDGGVYANNPALCAYAEARKLKFSDILNDDSKVDHPGVNDMIIISIGTGSVIKPYSYDRLRKAGKIAWINPLIDMLLSANVETVDYQLRQMYNTLGPRNRKNYYRIEPDLKGASPEMDDASKENIMSLIQAGLSYIYNHKQQLQEVVDKLVKNK